MSAINPLNNDTLKSPFNSNNKLEFLLRTNLKIEELRKLLYSITSESDEIIIEEIDLYNTSKTSDKRQKIGEILVERGAISIEDLNRELAQQKPIGERLVEKGLITKQQLDEALTQQIKQRIQTKNHCKNDNLSSLRVSSVKLDKLVNLIGELVTVQERLSQVTTTLRNTRPEYLSKVLQETNLSAISEEVSRLTNSLRENALSIRMLPVEVTFSKFKRVVHDLALELGKEIELIISGGETEIDKTVIDKLDEPLIHLIRNSADHGIEPPEIRCARGKPSKGIIHLSAEHVGGNVVIHVSDDGQGLNKDAIFAKAVEKKLIPPDAKLSEKEIYELIFLPGFSTATKVTNISGRGVGMDVVKKTIEELRGTIDINSFPGQGTQIDIRLPLTLAIIDGLLVTVDKQPFILPLPSVEECIQLQHNKNNSLIDKNLIEVRNQAVPFIVLRQVFGMNNKRPEIEQMVVCRTKDTRIGLVVDQVVGEHKTVIKPLGKIYSKSSEFSGASILGDGSIALIIDVERLLRGK